MKPRISLTGILIAALMFAVAVVMHEAARADSLLAQGVTPVADRLMAKPGKKPLGFKGSGASSHAPTNCVYGNDGITRCDDCDADGVCIIAAICYDNNGIKIACP